MPAALRTGFLSIFNSLRLFFYPSLAFLQLGFSVMGTLTKSPWSEHQFHGPAGPEETPPVLHLLGE